MKKALILWGFFFLVGATRGQDTVYLSNPSFEGQAGNSQVPQAWAYRGFPNETPPDLLPFRANTYFRENTLWTSTMNASAWGFGVSLPAVDGKTYLGMVTRDNQTVEALSQKLDKPLQPGICYSLQLCLASSPIYYSLSRQTGEPANYNWPVKLRIEGIDLTGERLDLLAQTPPVDHPNWQPYTLILRPRQTIQHLQITAWYPSDSLTNGNILIDQLSPLRPCPCAQKSIPPPIDTIDYTIPNSRQQAHTEVIKQAAQIRFSIRGQWLDVSTFRFGGHRAVRANPHWFFCRKILAKYPASIDVAIYTEQRKTLRAVRQQVKQGLANIPGIHLRRVVKFRPKRVGEWPVPPSQNGIAIRFR